MRLLTTARDLSRRKARERDGRFVAEGVRTVEELLASPVELVGVVCGPQLMDSDRGTQLRLQIDRRGIPLAEVTEKEFGGAASTESPQGVLAIGRIPSRQLSTLADREHLTLLVLDGVQDPGNVGTMIRTAHALGADATVALPGTVDVWNAKVVRSAMGSLFRHHVQAAPIDELAAFAAAHGVELWAAEASGAELTTLRRPNRLGLVLGNEGAGVGAALEERLARRVSLAMPGGAESLNVAIAAGILLYGLRP
ncbi:MAG: RNA methyltransferase [Gemmatimonadetes bacterium]|nr:RNA methyltransferase [Gemmatimonadota bacterium]